MHPKNSILKRISTLGSSNESVGGVNLKPPRAIKSGDLLTITTAIGNRVITTNVLILRILQLWIESGYQGDMLDFLRECWPDLPKDPLNFDKEEMDRAVELEIPRIIVGEQDSEDWEHINKFMEYYK